MLAERFPPEIGGSARSAARTAAALAALGVEVDVLCWTRRLPSGAMETADSAANGLHAGITLHRLGLYANWDLSLQHTLNVLEWLHETRKFDCVWGHYLYPAGFLAVLFAKSAGLACTVSARGNDVDRLVFPPGDFARLLWTLEQADLITAASHNLAKKIDVLLGRDGGVQVVHNSVDVDLFSPGPADATLREKLGIAADEAILVFSGELRHKKGVDFLMSAFRAVRQVRPAFLLIIGDARAEEGAKLAAFAADFPEDARRMAATGHLENQVDVVAHLRLADIFLHPSLWEGLPNALLEAMSCAKIAIASDAGGIPEVIEQGRSGFLVPRPQLHRLAEAVLEVLSLPEGPRAEVQRAARERILAAFHPAIELAALRSVIERTQTRRDKSRPTAPLTERQS